MADIAPDIGTWSSTPGSNQPQGTATIGAGLDDNLRAVQAGFKAALEPLSSVAGTNTITGTCTGLTAYFSGERHVFLPAATNTGATTLNVTSLGAKNVFFNGAACVGKELKIGVPVEVEYDGTQFNILSNGLRPGLNFLASGTGATAAVADITSGLTSTFDSYRLYVRMTYPANNGDALWLRVSEDAGSTFKAGASDYGYATNVVNDGGTGAVTGASTGDTKITLTAGVNNANATGVNGWIEFFNPSNPNINKNFIWQLSYIGTGGGFNNINGAARYYGTNNAINALRLMFSSGNLTVVKWELYGIREA